MVEQDETFIFIFIAEEQRVLSASIFTLYPTATPVYRRKQI